MGLLLHQTKKQFQDEIAGRASSPGGGVLRKVYLREASIGYPVIHYFRGNLVERTVDDLWETGLHGGKQGDVSRDVRGLHDELCEVCGDPLTNFSPYNARVGRVAAGELNNFNAAVIVESDEVAGGPGFILPDVGIRLEGAGTAIVDVIHGGCPPVHGEREQRPERQHDNHTQAEIE